MRADAPTLLVDAGDHTHPAPERDERLNRFVRHALSAMDYDALSLGELELQRGAPYVQALLDSVAIPVVLANVRFRATGEPVGAPMRVRKGGVECAVVGLFGPELAAGDSTVKSDFTIDDPFAAARTLVPALRREAELVVVLAHLPGASARALAEEVPGIDVLVLGHERNPVPPAKLGATVTLTSGERGQWLSYAEIAVEPAGGVLALDGAAVPLTLGKFPERADLAAELRALQRTMNDERRSALAAEERRLKALQPLPGQDRYVGDLRCARCHAEIFAEWQGTRHAHAFATLTDKHQDQDPECLACHVTGFGAAGGFLGQAPYQDMRQVQCESCHGMGTLHDMSGHADPDPGEATCKRCHTPEMSPEFDFDTYWQRIVH